MSSVEEQDNLKLMELAYKISLADGSCSNDEYSLLVRFQQELGLDFFPDTQTIDELIDYFSKRDKRTQKSAWLRIYTLIVADNNYDESEKNIVNKIKLAFTISSEEFDKIAKAVDDLNDAYLKLYEAIE